MADKKREGWLLRDCVVNKNGDRTRGKKGDHIKEGEVGNHCFEQLAAAGVLSKNQVEADAKPKAKTAKK